jgi:hypothetical protein
MSFEMTLNGEIVDTSWLPISSLSFGDTFLFLGPQAHEKPVGTVCCRSLNYHAGKETRLFGFTILGCEQEMYTKECRVYKLSSGF